MIWWIFILVWIMLGILAFYLEVKNTTREQMIMFFDDRKLELFVVFITYCIIGALFLVFSLLEDNIE